MAGAAGCDSCHGDGETSRASACLECHDVIAGDIAQQTGLHGTFEKNVRQACNLCHSEHHGANFSMVNARTFLLAEIPDVQAFDHERVGWPLEGAHLEQSCEDCHTNAAVAVLEAGQHRYVGESRDCGTCHEDPHRGALGGGCAECHSQQSFTEFGAYEHPGVLALTGGHAGISCRECHGEGKAFSLEANFADGPRTQARECVACHEHPHTQGFLRQIAPIANLALGALGCDQCHAEGQGNFVPEPATFPVPLHRASGMALEKPHADVECAQCHGQAPTPFAERFPGREAERCGACHEDPHGGQFDGGPFGDPGCVTCHGTQAFEPHGFDLKLHATTGFALEGRHAQTECAQCHTREGQDPRRFAGTAMECAACHDDVHDGVFAAQGHGDCSECHGAVHFTGGEERGFDHAMAGFALLGAHSQANCEACHRVPAQGRTLGNVLAGTASGAACATCHGDPHGGRLQGEFAGGPDCRGCHDEVSFRRAAAGFDHGAHTGFDLGGAHAAIACSGCHTPLFDAQPGGRSFAFAAGSGCVDCHADPHGGQFDLRGRTDCATCHSAGSGFADLTFDHDRDSRFALDQTHAALACAACHKRPVGQPDAPIHYKPLGIECRDCHGETRKDLKPGGGKKSW
ncbi:MAG: cytochrome c3 family protein [Planctomycetota bacterium]